MVVTFFCLSVFGLSSNGFQWMFLSFWTRVSYVQCLYQFLGQLFIFIFIFLHIWKYLLWWWFAYVGYSVYGEEVEKWVCDFFRLRWSIKIWSVEGQGKIVNNFLFLFLFFTVNVIGFHFTLVIITQNKEHGIWVIIEPLCFE